MKNAHKHVLQSVIALATLAAFTFSSVRSEAQQKDLVEVNILTAVSNMAFSALWVAEQLKYFEQGGRQPALRARAHSKSLLGDPAIKAEIDRLNAELGKMPQRWRYG